MDTTIQGIVRRFLPDVLVEGGKRPFRLSHRGDVHSLSIFNGNQAAAAERSYFTGARTGTRNTGVNLTLDAGTTYAATQALLIVVNNNPVGGPDVIMDYLSIKIDTAITGGTFWYLYHALDTGNRYASGSAEVPMQNADGSRAPNVTVYAGPLTASAATGNVRDVGYNLLANGISAAGAIHTVRYGRLENPVSGTFTSPTTAVAQTTVDAPAIVIPPGSSYVLNEFQTSRSATGVGEVFVAMIVR